MKQIEVRKTDTFTFHPGSGQLYVWRNGINIATVLPHGDVVNTNTKTREFYEEERTEQQFRSGCDLYGVTVLKLPDAPPALPVVKVTHGVRYKSTGTIAHVGDLESCQRGVKLRGKYAELVALSFGEVSRA